MLTYSKFVKEVEIEPNIFEIHNNVFDKGSCQCFKDCDCYKNKGKFLFTDVRYRNNLVKRIDGKFRTYSTLSGSKESLKAFKLKEITIKEL